MVRDLIKARRPFVDGDLTERWEGDNLGGSVRQPSADFRDFMSLYGAHPWVYTCVTAIAQAIAHVRYKILNSKGEEIKDQNILKVFKNPNPHQTWFEFCEAFVTYLELVGNAFLEEVRGKDGKLVAIFPLRPDQIKILPHPRKKIAGYIYSTTTKAKDDIAYDAEEITHLKYFNPLNEYWGISPGWASQNGLTLDFWSLAYNKGYFKRGAEPGFVLEAETSLSDAAYSRLLDAWKKRHEGVSKAHTPAILEEGLKYKPISPSQKDMQFIETRRMTREEILAAWRVPPVVVGLLEFASYASSREQRKLFWMDNIIPKLTRISEVINANLMDEGYEFKFDIESITSLIEDDQVAANIGMQYTTHGVMTINEFRKKYLNLPPVPWGDVWWAPMGFAPIKDDKPPAPALPPGGSPSNAQTSRDEMVNGLKGPAFVPKSAEGEYEYLDKVERPEPDWNNKKDVWLWNRWTLWKGTVLPDVRRLDKEYRAFFRGQLDRLSARARASDWPAPAKDTSKSISKADLPKDVEDWLVQIDADKKILSELISDQAARLLKKHGTISAGTLGVNVDFNIKDPRVTQWMEKYAGAKVTQISDSTRDSLRRNLVEAVEKGEDFKQVMERLRNVLDGPIAESRARRIAQTEIVTLTNKAKLDAAKESGVVKTKVWISELLPSTRDSHRDVHGTTIPIDDDFMVKSRTGYDEMEGPGDITADPENLVNCYCVLDYPPTSPEFQDLFAVPQKRLEKADAPPVKTRLPIEKEITLIKDPKTGELAGSRVKITYEEEEPKNGHNDPVPSR